MDSLESAGRAVDVARSDRRDAAAVAVVMLAVLAFGVAFTMLGPVLRPFLVAVFLFYAAGFASKTLSRLGLGPRLASLCVLPCAVIAMLLFGQLVSREAAKFLEKWPKYETKIARLINAFAPSRLPEKAGAPASPVAAQPARPADAPESSDAPDAEPADTDETAAADLPALPPRIAVPPSLGTFFRQIARSSLDYVFRHGLDAAELFILVCVYLLFLVIGSRKLPARIMRAFPGEQGERLLLIQRGITASMERFMAVKTSVGLGMAATAGLLMFLFGLDHWLLWAFLFFIANYVTYIGSMAACVPPILLAFVDLPSPTAATVLAVLLILNRLLWIDFVEIRMSGRQLNLDPTLMFLWLAYWGSMWGVLGLLLAYPMMAAVKTVLSHVKGCEGWAVLLSDE
jgi:predicted PurR-regulated permease PerM